MIIALLETYSAGVNSKVESDHLSATLQRSNEQVPRLRKFIRISG
jgi:hypothetical protein